jgi:hypothetical protein
VCYVGDGTDASVIDVHDLLGFDDGNIADSGTRYADAAVVMGGFCRNEAD